MAVVTTNAHNRIVYKSAPLSTDSPHRNRHGTLFLRHAPSWCPARSRRGTLTPHTQPTIAMGHSSSCAAASSWRNVALHVRHSVSILPQALIWALASLRVKLASQALHCSLIEAKIVATNACCSNLCSTCWATLSLRAAQMNFHNNIKSPGLSALHSHLSGGKHWGLA